MTRKVWEWHDDARAETFITKLQEAHHWMDVCYNEGLRDEYEFWAARRGGMLEAARILFGVTQASALERLVREREGGTPL